MSPYKLLAAYRLSLKAATTLVFVRNSRGLELQMRNHDGGLFNRIALGDDPP